jgi:hypothetical protein
MMLGAALLSAPAVAQALPPAPQDAPAEQAPEAPAADPSAPAAQQEAQTPQQDPLAPLNDPKSPGDDASAQAWQVIDWVIASHDNNEMPFIVIDKAAARVFVFDATGQRVGSSPALVGMTAGDETSPGVGDRELSNIPPKDRTTPAGRFVAKFGRAAGHRDVLWVDYPSAISLHAVLNVPKQHRFERLKSPTPNDNRITYGCINVPAEFYAKVVKPLFKGTAGVVYILPDIKPLNEVFMAMPPQPQVAAASEAISSGRR